MKKVLFFGYLVLLKLPDHQAEEQKLSHSLLCIGIYESGVEIEMFNLVFLIYANFLSH